jgi:ferrous iron transport protein A
MGFSATRPSLDRIGGSLDARAVSSRTLGTLSVGESGEVAGIDGDGALVVRLAEMGFVVGTHVRLVKVAPLGDPLQLTLRGYHVSLRRAEAARVRIA